MRPTRFTGTALAPMILLMLTTACGDGDDAPGLLPDAGQQSDAGVTGASVLHGLWRVELVQAGPFAIADELTLEFPAESSGRARIVGRNAASNVNICGEYVFALVDRALLLESARFPEAVFLVERLDEARLSLTSADAELKLVRVDGPPPFEACATAQSETLAVFDSLRPGYRATLSAVGETLYFNVSDADASIVGFDLRSGTLGGKRRYTVSSGGGVDRMIVAAESDDIFFGHCGCGRSERLSRFDLAADARLIQVNTDTDLGAAISVAFASHLGAELVVGGRGDGQLNRLLSLDAATLALRSERAILEDTEVVDIAHQNGKLYALTEDGTIVAVNGAGKAAQTWALPALRGLQALGLTSSGGAMYLLAVDEMAGATHLLKVMLD